MITAINFLVITAIDFNALGFSVSDLEVSLTAGIGLLIHIVGFLGLAKFIFSDEREYLFPRKKGAES